MAEILIRGEGLISRPWGGVLNPRPIPYENKIPRCSERRGILIGTCGYSYHEWVGPVYPEGTKPGGYLACYAGLFPTGELDFAFYGMPKPENLAKMLVDGGPSLTFAIKAFQELTHRVDPFKWPEVAKRYLDAIAPLREAAPGFVSGVCAVQDNGLACNIPVYPLYHQGIPYGNHENAASFGDTGVEDGYIPIADVGFYHAVPGNIDGQKALRAVGGYEGAGDLEKLFFGVVLRFPAMPGGGFLIQ
jgi:hypothetical protein